MPRPCARPRAGFSALLALALAAPGAVAQSVPLEWRWTPGDEARYTLTERMQQSISGPIQSELNWTRKMGYSDLIAGVEGGKATVERAFEWVDIDVARDTEPPAHYDTRDPAADPRKADPLLIAPFIALAGQIITFTVDSEGHVSDVKGSAEALDAMLGPLTSGELGRSLTAFSWQVDRAQRLAKQLEQALGVIPGRAVRRGEHWPVEIDHVTPLQTPLTSDITATLGRWNRRDQTAQIAIDGNLVQSDEGEQKHFSNLLCITLDSGTITGSITFDTERGQIVKSEMDLRTAFSIRGDLVGEEGETQHQTLTQKATLERLDTPQPGRGRRP